VIELRNVTKSYRTHAGTNIVLDDVTIRFHARESIGILGVNGAGKSTLLRIAGAAELPDSGEVIRNGQVSWPIGFTGGFNSSLTGEENCRFVARIYSRSVDDVTDATAEFAEIGDYFYMPVRTYSSGMRARLAFGLSMAIDFDVYLVDEVTAVGDRRFRAKCEAAFEERQERSCLVIVSHNLATIRTYCERCAVMANGKLVVYDSVDEASEAYEALSA
jgi:capsular polysaccharide transport system ATP-binding protein